VLQVLDGFLHVLFTVQKDVVNGHNEPRSDLGF
jgi:hypothetical protein